MDNHDSAASEDTVTAATTGAAKAAGSNAVPTSTTAGRPGPGQRNGAPASEGPKPQIPWHYGEDTLCAMAVDPVQLYLYWEVSDQRIAEAYARLGEPSPHHGHDQLHLRIYDTTDRLFDGTNAHSAFDCPVQRSDRQWFAQINKPTSTAHIELGLKGGSGRFVPMLRSGRVDFPRRERAAGGPVEWMTVRDDGQCSPSGGNWGSGAPAGGEPSADAPASNPPGGGAAGSASNADAPQSSSSNGTHLTNDSWSTTHEIPLEGLRSSTVEHRTEWSWQALRYLPDWEDEALSALADFPTVSWTRVHTESSEGAISWTAEGNTTSWTAGPFSYPVQIDKPSVEAHQAGIQRFQVGNQVHVLHGPWQVTIRGLGARTHSQVVARWSIHRTWAQPVQRFRSRTGAPRNGRPMGSSDHRPGDSGQWILQGASELRLSGSSELHLLGASELRLLGASELRFLSASELSMRGASELRLQGASELRLQGGSEARLRGASEGRLGGASEGRLGGASEARLGGASEGRLRNSNNPANWDGVTGHAPSTIDKNANTRRGGIYPLPPQRSEEI